MIAVKRSRLRVLTLVAVATLIALALALAGQFIFPNLAQAGLPPPPGETDCRFTFDGFNTWAVCESKDHCTRTYKLDCGWVLVKKVCPPPGPSLYVEPLPGDDPAMFVPGPGGMLPCGVFDVLMWGHRVAQLDSFPGCAPYGGDLTVYCLNDQGTWTNDYISDVLFTLANNDIAFQSMQHGTCGLFPTQ